MKFKRATLLVVLALIVSGPFAQEPQERAATYFFPQIAVGEVAGINWVTHLTFYNWTDETRFIDLAPRDSRGDLVWLKMRFHDGTEGFSNPLFSQGMDRVPPKGTKVITLLPCTDPSEVVVLQEQCQGNSDLLIGYVEGDVMALWSEEKGKYLPSLQVQVTLQALQDGVPFSSLSYPAFFEAPDKEYPSLLVRRKVFSVVNTDLYSTGIAMNLWNGEGIRATLILRDSSGAEIVDRTYVDLRSGESQHTALMLEELFPGIPRNLNAASLEIRFLSSFLALSVGEAIAIRVDYATGGQARLANSSEFEVPLK